MVVLALRSRRAFQYTWNARFAMKKLLLLSVIIASIAIPVRLAAAKNPRKALRKVLIQAAVFNLFYLFALVFLWARV